MRLIESDNKTMTEIFDVDDWPEIKNRALVIENLFSPYNNRIENPKLPGEDLKIEVGASGVCFVDGDNEDAWIHAEWSEGVLNWV